MIKIDQNQNKQQQSQLIKLMFLNLQKRIFQLIFSQKIKNFNPFSKQNLSFTNTFNLSQSQMSETKQGEQKSSKQLFESCQKDYVSFLKSLLPSSFLQEQNKTNNLTNARDDNYLSNLDFFNTKPITKSNHSLSKSRIANTEVKRNNSSLGQFLLKLVKAIAKYKHIDQFGQLQNITKELGIDIKQVNKIENSDAKVQFMMNSIDSQIEEQKKKLLFGSKPQATSTTSAFLSASQKTSSNPVTTKNLSKKENNFFGNSELPEKASSKYQQFVKQQNKKDVDNFPWLQIKTKYPMLEKKLKAKLIQSINEDKNQGRIRELIEKKQKNKKQLTNNLTFSNFKNNINQSSFGNLSMSKDFSYFNRQSSPIDIEDEKIDLVNESLFMEEFQSCKIEYTWSDNDQKMFIKNIKQLRKKCSNNSEFLKLCGRFKFISQKEFQTLASEDISRMLNKNNKIYLSREFLLDKYFSTTETLTEQQMKFILKTSPMLSKCVDRNFIKTAIKNIRYENISDLELKIAQDIIGKFEKLRNSVRDSRKTYKQQLNKVAKQRIAFFEKNQEIQVARQIAQQQLKNHKVHLMRALNYKTSRPYSLAKISNGLSKKKTKNIWTPLNRYHPSTGLFVKDCNEQCTDDIFNPYEKQYIKKIDQTKIVPKKSIVSRVEMIKFYTGGPDESITTTFDASQKDVQNVCSIIKAYFFQKKILAAIQPVDACSSDIWHPKRQDSKSFLNDLKTKNTLGLSAQEELETMAKKKLLENREKAKQTVYVNKLLVLSAENAFQSLKSLNPQFTSEQVNTKDKKGNTALYYACKYGNEDFVEFLMRFSANPNTKCEKQFTPLHLGFKSGNITLILNLLTSSHFPPNLNALNSQFKTPLAYCSRQILRKLNLEDGITLVDPSSPIIAFDNNTLLEKEEFDKVKIESLEMQGSFAKRIKQNVANRKVSSALTSIKNMNF